VSQPASVFVTTGNLQVNPRGAVVPAAVALADSVGIAVAVGDADGDVRAGVFDACGPQALMRASNSSAETPDALFTAGPYRRASTPTVPLPQRGREMGREFVI